MIRVGSLCCFIGELEFQFPDVVRAYRPSPHNSASCFGQGKQAGIQKNSHMNNPTPGIHFQKQLQRGQGSKQRGIFLPAPWY